tara:strand:- start:298 stop:2469 length:2172 start_codon:yes stop_codon:yes gene_type:complete
MHDTKTIDRPSLFDPMRKNFQRNFLLISFVLIIFQCLFLFLTIRENLKKPTRQDLAKVGLTKFGMAKSSEDRKSIFNRYQKDRIFLWPMDGISLNTSGKVTEKIDDVLMRDFGDEYRNLNPYEKKYIKEKTLPFIERNIKLHERKRGFFENDFKGSFEEELFMANNLVGLTRYKWNSYKKNMLFIRLNNHLYFASISDAIEKTSFLISILFPLVLLITSSFLLIYLNYFFNMKKQNIINDKIKALLEDTKRKNNQLDAQRKDLKNLLENLGQGFMIFNEEGLIQDGATLASKNIFQCEPEGKSIDDVLRLNEEEKENFKNWRKNVWKGVISFKDLLALAPSHFNKIEKQIVQLEFRAIYENKRVNKVICVASDKTKEAELLKKIEIDREDVQFIKLCLSRPLEFIDLMNDTTELFTDFPFKGELETEKEEIFRTFHTLKARYGQFGQKNLTYTINKMETIISKSLWSQFREEFEKIDNILKDFFKKHRNVIEAANKLIIDEVQTIDAIELNHKMYEVESIEELKTFVLENYILKDFKSLFYRYERILEDLAEEQGKEVDVKISGDKILVDPKEYYSLVNISIHLFRNIIDHGVESKEERIERAKPEKATIHLSFKRENERVRIILEDDGRGIDPDLIKVKAIERKIKTEEQINKLDDKELINLIFVSGFSTKTSVTDISGRGVGMNAVKSTVMGLRGTIIVTSIVGQKTSYIIDLPYLINLKT